jgi:hypothetical protein
MKIRYFWKIYHLMGLFPWKGALWENSNGYMYYVIMPRGGGSQVKIDQTFNGCSGPGASVITCCAKGLVFKSCKIF